tara:strand:+ start:517 stop:846 length:330 start_codon:yes stop_codon:yes gene_type:complete
MIESKKIFHLHLSDYNKNLYTLIGRLTNGEINYIFYGGTGSSGSPFSLRNIQFYDIVNGNMRWVKTRSLPVENHENETIVDFKNRVINMLNKSTKKVIKEVNTNVKFKN